jgi:DHA1 family chloramphenicol resistance protein-like MFS transporter
VLAGVVLNTGAGVAAVPWIGAGLALITTVAILLDRRITRRARPADDRMGSCRIVS